MYDVRDLSLHFYILKGIFVRMGGIFNFQGYFYKISFL